MNILHVIRDPHERLALELARHQSAHNRVSLLLIQDAVLARPMLDAVSVYTLAEDLEARGAQHQGVRVDYDEAVRLMVGHDKMVVW